MAYLSKSDLNRVVGQKYTSAPFSEAMRIAATKEKINKYTTYDIFLSHSILDRETILQINYLLEEELGLSVFVDWIEMPELDRTKVTPETADQLRTVMGRCGSLIYAISANSSTSKWMPWELGYSDAKHGRVAVLPIADASATLAAYSNQEFVGLYPYVDAETILTGYGGTNLRVKDWQDNTRYADLKSWRRDGRLIKHG